MFEIYLVGFALGLICGIIAMYFHIEAKYIDELDKPVINELIIEIEEETHGDGDPNFDATRWLDSRRS